jgi:hypothetical protein
MPFKQISHSFSIVKLGKLYDVILCRHQIHDIPSFIAIKRHFRPLADAKHFTGTAPFLQCDTMSYLHAALNFRASALIHAVVSQNKA